ncbi:hypothetical protein TC41_1059 [Alicyclobacillus acidocaldarius subsp. acidocaldarius Tc-4-1]|uniref:Uncharacterized protein n=1 Tax=Alicyclobacillus acidocaldarius (strain Tc-4-1) TaxID=1048834 RepID=F8IGB4_ALIAT|nr:hypothetical protein TC41_1059 [Alicyclobacillus acidocaldarius subsp. acidocaldarius Tc-4-1]
MACVIFHEKNASFSLALQKAHSAKGSYKKISHGTGLS